MTHPWLRAVRADLVAAGDAGKAVAQQAYMKSELPYHGIAAPDLKRLLRPHLAGYRPADRAVWEHDVRSVWDDATHREERYAALALARHRAAAGWLDAGCLDLARHLVVTGAWWDVVDETAAHVVGPALAADRAAATPTIRDWAHDDDLWLRRTAVIAQNGHRTDTDLDLFVEAIETNLDDRSFWLRKAIGWALRDYARHDPAWVRGAVEVWGDRLSGLSRREALKHLG